MGGMKVHEAALGSVLLPSDKHSLAGLARLPELEALAEKSDAVQRL